MHKDDPPDPCLGQPRFAPFIRHDQYGHLGLKPQHWAEYLRLAICAATVLPLKVLGQGLGVQLRQAAGP